MRAAGLMNQVALERAAAAGGEEKSNLLPESLESRLDSRALFN